MKNTGLYTKYLFVHEQQIANKIQHQPKGQDSPQSPLQPNQTEVRPKAETEFSSYIGCDRLESAVTITYANVSQTVVLGFCPCGPLRLNNSPKKTEKIKLT
jgi:hypothetical protein